MKKLMSTPQKSKGSAMSWLDMIKLTSQEEFRRVCIIVFAILLSALILWVLYFNYLMFGDFFTGAFLAIVVSIPLEREKQRILEEFRGRITSKPQLKATKNSAFVQGIHTCYLAVKFLLRNSKEGFIWKLKQMWRNVIELIKSLANKLLSDLIILIITILVYVSVMKNSLVMGAIITGAFLLLDITIRLIVDACYYIMKLINDKIFPLFNEEGKAISMLTYGLSVLLILITLISIALVVGMLILLIISEINEFKELWSYLYQIIESWVKESKISHYLLNDNEGLIKTIRHFAEDYGESISAELGVPINLTVIVNGTKEELQEELVRDANLVINSTFAFDSFGLYDFFQGFSISNFSIASSVPFIHTKLSKVLWCMSW
eukprot:TRINITY_DN4899_c0_g3_i1.p1 TRINITY_DN4899_c0_g3~~TRINITY_DN4899_c0_g3_i1.p1  ORF type:complete len:377 (+),score=76.64 TRINITY_DN4899_c0_g3_i1:144-1274(+)